MSRIVFPCLLALLPLGVAHGQAKDPFDLGVPKKPGANQPAERVTVSATVEPAKARRGTEVTLAVRLKVAEGYHTYPTKQKEKSAESQVTQIEVVSDSLTLIGEWKNPPTKTHADPAFGMVEHIEGSAAITGMLRVKPEAKPGKHEFKLKVSGLVCDENACVPMQADPTLAIEITDEPPVAAVPAAGSGEASKPGESSVWWFVLEGIIWGFASLLTPCVFPMIPITVSFFLKQSEQKHHRPLLLASVYTLTIVLVLALAALLLLRTFKEASQHWAMNFFLGGLFIYFALSLFGMYEIELPSGLARFTSAREGRGGLVGTVFMALTFTIVSFACVAPFLGTFAGLAAQRQGTFGLFAGALAYSLAFASPFFLLALFPSMVKRLPKSGSWLNNVKVVMAFLEVAAAIKFLRAGELILLGEAKFLTYDLCLGLYIALGILCGLYLLNLYRLPHDTPAEHLGVPQLVLSLMFIGLSLYLLPGLSEQRPRGTIFAWVDSFLVPDSADGSSLAARPGSAPGASEALTWRGNMKDALQVARETQPPKLVFIDFTGVG